MAQTAICARVLKLSFVSMLLTWDSMVRSLSTRRSAIARLVWPAAMRTAISRSRVVSPWGPRASLRTVRASTPMTRCAAARKRVPRRAYGSRSAMSSAIATAFDRATPASALRPCFSSVAASSDCRRHVSETNWLDAARSYAARCSEALSAVAKLARQVGDAVLADVATEITTYGEGGSGIRGGIESALDELVRGDEDDLDSGEDS